MREEHPNRRLAAILAADVVGYSRMMGADEAGTLAALKRHRETVFDPAVAEHNGRVVKLIGDGTLVEFASVVDAVKCALVIQRAIRTEMRAHPNGRNIMLRIGVNLGDVIIDGDDIYGEGVNVAARLEPLAEPGGVCVASIVNESVGSRVDITFTDGGEVHVKNIERPMRVWKWHPDSDPVVAASSARADEAPQRASETASIAVLPFDNMSQDPEQEYFSDGITEDIITDLSKIGGLKVIARNSSFAYKGKSPDIRAVGRDLGVKSVLEGSIRRAGSRVRITAQLIDSDDGSHLWAERYDRDLTDIFEVQDEVTQRIVAALKVTLTRTETNLPAVSGPKNVEAHDLLLRARANINGTIRNRGMFEQTRTLLQQAIEFDPTYAEAYAALSVLCALDSQNNWSGDHKRSTTEALHFADRAIAVNGNEPMAHYAAAVASNINKDLERARTEAEATLALNPNFALAHDSLGVVTMLSGEPLQAIPHFERAMRLDPANRQQLHFLGMAYLLAGKFATAAAYFRERIVLVPESDFSRAYLAAALGQLGEVDEARRIWRELKEINPDYSFEEHVGRLPFKVQADVDRIREGLAKAGLL
jgi:adenylate cyclase